MAEAVSGSVRVFAPNVLSGLIEVRGVGIVRVGCVAAATLVLVADLAECSEIKRLPEPLSPAVICGIEVRRVLLAPFEGSAPLKLLLALSGAATA